MFCSLFVLSVALAVKLELPVSKLRFSRDSIDGVGHLLETFENALYDIRVWQEFPALEVAKRDLEEDFWFVFSGNRRLWVLQQMSTFYNMEFFVPVKEVAFDPTAFTTQNDGIAVEIQGSDDLAFRMFLIQYDYYHDVNEAEASFLPSPVDQHTESNEVPKLEEASEYASEADSEPEERPVGRIFSEKFLENLSKVNWDVRYDHFAALADATGAAPAAAAAVVEEVEEEESSAAADEDSS